MRNPGLLLKATVKGLLFWFCLLYPFIVSLAIFMVYTKNSNAFCFVKMGPFLSFVNENSKLPYIAHMLP